ncbi:MAG: hypothetical protein IT442_16370, partial [Phycisphaeraceae bacterium]|nr:hypothetical protein [Phycisphaeraceae bacterium]
MRAEWHDSLEHLYPDSAVGERARESMSLDVARGGTGAAHVLVNGLREGDALRLSVREAGRAVREAKWFVLIDVPVEANTGPVGFIERENERNEFVARRAPFRVYDAMSPAGATVRVTAGTMGLRLHVPVALDARAGRRRYEVGITHGGDTVSLGLMVDVHRVRLPGVGEKSWPYTNWFSYDLIAQRHGLKLWSEPYWRMLRKYAELMAHGRQNTFLTPLGAIFRSSEKGVVLDAGRLRRIVKVFTDAGMHWIEGGHWAGRTGNEWLAKTFDLSIGSPRPLASSPEGAKVMAVAGRQLMAEMERQGWRGRWLQHVAVEPIGANATDYRLIAGMVRRYMPGVPILDA